MKNMEKWVWTVLNAVRGVIEWETAAYIMLYALLMRENELEKKPTEAAYSLEYLTLTYKKVLPAEKLAAFMKTLGDERWNMGGVLYNEAVRLFYNRSSSYDEGVRTIFKAVYDVDFQSREELFQAAKMILYAVMSKNGIRGEMYSSESVHKLEAKLLDCKEGMTVYDGFCGYGLSAILAAQMNGGAVYLQDINLTTTAIASIIAILSGAQIGQIQSGESFSNPLAMDEKFDRVIAEPPFYGRGMGKEAAEKIAAEHCLYADIQNIQTLPLRHMAAQVKESGLGIVLVPMGVLFSAGRVGEVRKRLLQDGVIQAVIELPSGALTNTNVKSALMVIGAKKKLDGVYMLSAEQFFVKYEKKQLELSDDSINHIVAMYRNQETKDGCANWVSLDEIAEKNYDLCPMTYMQQSAVDVIQIENIEKYQSRYKRVFEELIMLDKELAELRENL